MVYSTEGFTWTPSGGRRDGLQTIGAIVPPTHTAESQPEDDVYDVIVIGAGYAGLVAARDLATQGTLPSVSKFEPWLTWSVSRQEDIASRSSRPNRRAHVARHH